VDGTAAGATVGWGWPQFWQKPASSETVAPHFVQCGIRFSSPPVLELSQWERLDQIVTFGSPAASKETATLRDWKDGFQRLLRAIEIAVRLDRHFSTKRSNLAGGADGSLLGGRGMRKKSSQQFLPHFRVRPLSSDVNTYLATP